MLALTTTQRPPPTFFSGSDFYLFICLSVDIKVVLCEVLYRGKLDETQKWEWMLPQSACSPKARIGNHKEGMEVVFTIAGSGGLVREYYMNNYSIFCIVFDVSLPLKCTKVNDIISCGHSGYQDKLQKVLIEAEL